MRSFGKYRSFGHWLSYNWGWIALAAGVVFLFLYTRYLQPRPPEPDYRVSWVGVSHLSEEEELAVRTALERLGKDENGDGQVLVNVSQFIIDFDMDTSDPGFEDNYGNVTKLVAELQTAQCYLFLLDRPDRFQYATGALQYLDGTAAASEEGSGYECENWEQMCVPFQTEGSTRTAYLARRVIFQDKKSSQELFPGADLLFEAATGLAR